VYLIKWLTQLRPSREVGGVAPVVNAEVSVVAAVVADVVKAEIVLAEGAVEVVVTRVTKRSLGCPLLSSVGSSRLVK